MGGLSKDNFKGCLALDDSELNSVSGGLCDNYEAVSDQSPENINYIAQGVCPNCGQGTTERIGTGFYACSCGASCLVMGF